MQFTIPTDEEIGHAKEMAAHYRAVLQRNAPNQVEDETMLAAYREVARGRAVINAYQALAEGGVDERGCPRLMLARPAWRHCRWRGGSDGSGVLAAVPSSGRSRSQVIQLPDRTLPVRAYDWTDYYAIVPAIPPQLRPRGRLDVYVLLAEATWTTKNPVVAPDPALLRPIAWPLCAVVAVWDLTDLERTVLGITRGEK